MTHDSFYLPDGVIEAFEAANDVDVHLLPAGDAGTMVNQAILTADRPLADVLYGVDNTFLSRAIEADIFEPYRSPEWGCAGRLSWTRTGVSRPSTCRCLSEHRPLGLRRGRPAVPTRLEDLVDPR